MDEIAAGTIISRITKKLEEAAISIATLSEEMAEQSLAIDALKWTINRKEATVRVEISTATNDMGKPKYPNIDAQNAAVLIELEKDKDYTSNKALIMEYQKQIEIKKAHLNLFHETRRDARTEAELIIGLLRE